MRPKDQRETYGVMIPMLLVLPVAIATAAGEAM